MPDNSLDPYNLEGVLNSPTRVIWLALWNPPSLSEGLDGRRGIGRGWLINIPFSAIFSPLFPYVNQSFFKFYYQQGQQKLLHSLM